jgi:parallel beta-helix repeat protein
VSYVFNVRDYGAVADGQADDAPAIQAALDAARDAGGGEVQVPGGIYGTASTLLIYSNTRLVLAPTARIVRIAEFGNMLRPGVTEVAAYDGAHDIEIVGGTWDHNGDVITKGSTVLTFGHAKRVTIRDLAIINTRENHCIEINAVKHARILNCRFERQVGERHSEAVQIDLMLSSTQFPAYGLYDNTPCEDVLIQGCTFLDWSRGIGTHSYADGVYHKNIRIIGNHFEGLYHEAIRGLYWDNATVKGNTIYRCGSGIEMLTCFGWTVGGNIIRDCATNGISVYDGSQDNSITGNVIEGSGAQGISLYNGADNNAISGNVVKHSGQYGIVLNSSVGNTVAANTVYGNSQSADNSYDNIRVTSGADRNNVHGNTCGLGSREKRPRYGICLYNNAGNVVTANVLYKSGASGAISDGGTGTVKGGNIE